MKIYKIKDLETGLFSDGGFGGYYRNTKLWSKNGKTWKRLSDVKNHISQAVKASPQRYRNAFIIEYEVTEKESISIEDMLNEKCY